MALILKRKIMKINKKLNHETKSSWKGNYCRCVKASQVYYVLWIAVRQRKEVDIML